MNYLHIATVDTVQQSGLVGLTSIALEWMSSEHADEG